MKLTTHVLMLAATAGLAMLAVTTRKPVEEPRDQEVAPTPVETDVDAWFI